MLAIKNISGEVIFADALTDKARYSHSLMESEYIALDFNALTGVELPVGSYIEHDGKVFVLIAPYAPEAVDGGWRYIPQFKAEWMAWDGIAFMFIDPAQARTETTWELTGNIEVFGKAITDNIERMTGKSYAFNYDSTLTKEVTMNFENSTVLSVLNDLAAAYGTEWWVEGDTIHLSMCRYGEEITLETEVNVGAPKVTASKENYGTRWYCYGSTRNIEQEYTNTSIANVSGIADSRLHLPADTYPNGYIDVKPNMKTGEIVERTLILDDIYPHSELTISRVEEEVKQMLDEDGNPVVDRYENGVAIHLTYSIFRFKVAGYELDEDDILPGKPVMVHFKSGLLTGYEFELTYRNKDDNMYPDTYEILYQTTGGGLIIPNSSLKPKEGDQITLFNIRMPDEYKAAAEKELAEKALKQIDYKLLLSAGTFTVNSYPKMFYYYGTMLTVGRNIAYINRSNTLHVRVLSVEYNLTTKWAQTAVIGYIKQSNRLATIEGQVEDMINGIKVIEGHVNSNTSSGNALMRITNSLNANKTKGVDVYYAASTSATIAPTEGWSTTPPVWTNDTYIWTKTITFYADGSSSETLPVCVNGVKGENGANGVGIKSIVEEYFLSSSNTELIGGDWSAVRPEKRDGWYIWTRSKIEYTDGKIERVGAVCATGDTGATGAAGTAAVVYSIMPSADKITVSVDDVLSDDSVSCTKYKTTGNSPRVETTEKILRYMRVGVDTLEINYAVPVKVTPATEYILFVLYETDGATILDMERVPVIVDSKGLKEEIEGGKTSYSQRITNRNAIDFDKKRGTAKVSTISGLTLKQYIKNGNFANGFDNWTTSGTKNDNGDYVTVVSAGDNHIEYTQKPHFVAGHKYVMLALINSTKGILPSMKGVGTLLEQKFTSTNKWSWGGVIKEYTSGSDATIYLYSSGTSSATIKISKEVGIMCFDLTELGLDTQLTTLQQCIEYFGSKYIAEGISASQPTAITSTSFNQFDRRTMVLSGKTINATTGAIESGSNYIIFAPCVRGISGGNNGYRVADITGANNVVRVGYNPFAPTSGCFDAVYDMAAGASGKADIIPSQAGYVIAEVTSLDNICVHLKWSYTDFSAQYNNGIEYRKDTLSLPVKAELGGLRHLTSSSRTLKADIVDFANNIKSTYIVKVSFDGTELWEKSTVTSEGFMFRYWQMTSFANALKGVSRFYALGSHYTAFVGGWADMQDKRYQLLPSSTVIAFRDSAYTSVDAWKQHLADLAAAGTPLTVYAALESPIETTVNNLVGASMVGQMPTVIIEDSTHVYPTDVTIEVKSGMQGIESSMEAINTTIGTTNALSNQLGYASYEEMVKAAELGDTVIKGGHIKTELIDAKSLVVNNLVTKSKDDDNDFISIEPNTGAQFFVDGKLEASMNAVKFSDVNELVPNSDLSVVLTEYGHSASVTHAEIVAELLTTGTYTNNTGIALNLTIPALTIHTRIYTNDSNPLSDATTSVTAQLSAELSYSINGSKTILTSTGVYDYDIELVPHYNNFGQMDGYLVDTRRTATTTARTITIPANGTLKITATHQAELETYGLLAECAVTIGNRVWDGRIYTTTLAVNGTKLLTQYGGNGLAFIKSTNQYIAMLANDNETQLEMRSGNVGFKVDSTGIYYYKNGWVKLVN